MRKRRRKLVLGLLLLLAAMVAVFPYLAAHEPLRGWMLRAVLPKINGTVSVGGASLGWLSPVRFENIEVRSPAGEPTLVIAALEGDRPLWRCLFSPRELGNVRLQRPQVNLVAGRQGSNLTQVFSIGEPPTSAAVPPDVSMGLEIVDARFSFRGAPDAQPWSVEGLNLALNLQPSSTTESRLCELVVRPGSVFSHTPITPPMCRDLLKYIAPVLAEATEVNGSLSIELDQWRIPLAAPQQAQGSGRLKVDSLRVAGGPLVRQISSVLQLRPLEAGLVDDSVVAFSMADGRVEHHGLKFHLGDVVVATHGSVALDQSLDMVADISLAGMPLGAGPQAQLLKSRPVSLPLRGTLSRPRIDAAALAISNRALLEGAVDNVLKEGGLLDRLLRPRRQSRDETPPQ